MKNFIFLMMTLGTPVSLLSQPRTVDFYVSSYDEKHPAGIAQYQLDYVTGKIKKIMEFDSEQNSDYLAISPNNMYLLSVAQDEDKKTGLITVFSINRETGALNYIDEEYSGGNDPCYISISRKNDFAIVAHYSGGNVTVSPLLTNGSLLVPKENILHQGSGPDTSRQGGPHPHMAYYQPKGNFVFVPDLGLDKIMVYKLNGNGHLKPAKSPFGSVAPGAGPRHFDLHPNGDFGYIVNELNSTITAFSFTKSTGELLEIQTINSLDEKHEGDNYLADIHITPDGKYLYASNRGHDSISIFAIDQISGKLTFLQTESCAGKWPRAFNIDPTGKYLIVANEHSDNMVVFQIDRSTGMLNKTFESAEFPAPRCIKFLH